MATAAVICLLISVFAALGANGQLPSTQPRAIGFMGERSRDFQGRRTGWTELTDNYWYLTAVTGRACFTSGHFKNSRFTAPKSGLYYVSANCRMDNFNVKHTFQLQIAVNGKINANSGLSSYETVTYYYNSKSVTGAIYMNAGDYISMWFNSVGDSSYTFQHESSFGAFYLGSIWSRVGAQLDINGQVNARTGWTTITSYVNNLGAGNLWLNSPSQVLNTRTGRFTAPCSGVYFLAANFQFGNVNRGGYYRLMAVVNNNYDVNNGLMAIRDGDAGSQWSLHISGNVYLAKGWYVEIRCYSSLDTSWYIGTSSGFTIMYMSPSAQFAPSTLADMNYDQYVTRYNWAKLSRWRTSGNQVLYNQNRLGSFNGGKFTIPQTGYYIVNTMVRFDGCAGRFGYQRLVITIDGRLDVNNGLHAIRGLNYPTQRYYSLHISQVVYLRSGQYLEVQVYMNYLSCWAQSESSFSVAYVAPFQPATGLHADKTTRDLRKAGWNEVSGYATTFSNRNGLYETDSNTASAKGRYTAQTAGVYYVGANIRMDLATVNYSRVVIAKNGKYSDSNSLSVMQQSNSKQTAGTQTVCGFMQLEQGDYISVFAYSPDTSWYINSASSVSVARIGSTAYVDSFLADLPESMPVSKAASWTPVRPFQTTSPTDHGIFQTDYSFTPVTGTFVAQRAGLYFFSANVRFDNVLASTTYRINIATRKPSLLNGLVTSRDTPSSSYPKSFSLTVSGTLRLNIYDPVNVFVYVSKVPALVSTETSFSGALVGYFNPQWIAFQVRPRSTISIRGNSYVKLLTSYTVTPSLNQYSYGFRISSGNFVAPQTGTYLVSANMKFAGLRVNAQYALFTYINGVRDAGNGLYSTFVAPSLTYSQGMTGSVLLLEGQSLSFYIYWYGTGTSTLLTESGFSATYISPQQYQPSSFLADLSSTLRYTTGAWVTLKGLSFGSNSISLQRGMHNFGLGVLNPSTGFYTVNEAGVYLITVTITYQNLGGSMLQTAVVVNNKLDTQSGMVAFYGNPLGTRQTIHISGLKSLKVGDTLSVRSLSGNDFDYYVGTETSFGAQYMGPASYGFSADLSSARGRTTSGYYLVNNWRTSGPYGLFDGSAKSFNIAAGTFTVKYDGLYLASASMRVDKADQGYFEAKVVVNGLQELNTPLNYAKSGAVGKVTSHLPISGVVPLKAGDVVTLQLRAERDTSFTIDTSCGFSMAYLIHPSAATGFIAQPSIVNTYSGYRWVTSGWATTGQYGFNSGNFDTKSGAFWTTSPGMYHVTINIRVTGLSGAIARAAISVDSCLPTGSTFCPNALYSDMQYLQDPLQPNTLLVSGVMALAAFRKLEVTLYCSAVCSIEKESVFSVIYMGTADNVQCNNGGPVMTVQPEDTFAQVGQSASITCLAHSAPDTPTYIWRKNGANIPGATSNVLTFPAVSSSDDARYYCLATGALGRSVGSWTSRLKVVNDDGETPAMSLYAGYRYTLRSGYAYLSRYFNPSLGSPFYVANPADFLSYSGSFTVRKAGVYLVSASVYVSSMSSSYAMMYISTQGSQTSSQFPAAAKPFTSFSARTLSCSGSLYVRKSSYIRVYVYNPSDSSWYVNPQSTFSVYYVGPAVTVPGVATRLISTSPPNYPTGWTEVNGFYRPTSNFYNQWMTGAAYDSVKGRYTADCDGIYFVSANLVISKSSTGGYMSLSLGINSITSYTDNIIGPVYSPARAVFSLNAARTVFLKSGQYVSPNVYMEKGGTWKPTSGTFSAVYIGSATSALPGMLAAKSGAASRGTGWYTIAGWKVSDPKTNGLYMTSSQFSLSSGIFTASTAGNYFVSASIRVESTCSGYFRLLIDVNNRRGGNGLEDYYTPGTQCQYSTLQVSGHLQLKAGDTVRLNIYSSTDKSWTIASNGLFSVQLIENVNPGLHADLNGDTAVTGKGWQELKKWTVVPSSSNGGYQSGAEFSPTTGRFTVRSDGIYFVSAAARVDRGDSGYFRMSIAVNNLPDGNGGLHAYEGYLGTRDYQFTMTASGFVYLRADDIVSVYVYSLRDVSYTVDTTSGFSVNYVAAPLETPSFLANALAMTFSGSSTKFYELTKFTTEGANSLFESGGAVMKNGRLVAPIDGTYFAVANIRITPTSATSRIYVRLAINSQYTNATSMVQATRSALSAAPFSLSISGSFRLNQNDYLSIFVGSSSTAKFTVGGNSAFSAAKVGSLLLPSLTTSQPARVNFRRTGNNYLSRFTDLTNYITSNGAVSGVYVMPQSGRYYVSYSIIVSSHGGPYVSGRLVVDGKVNTNNGMSNYRGAPSSAYFTLSGAGILRLGKGQRVQLMVYSVSDNNFWAQGSLSLSAAASATTLPSFSGQTSYRTVSRAGWTTNRYYNAPVGATNWFQSGPNVIDIATGFFNVLVPGVYSIHATVEFDMLLTDIARLAVAVNGQTISDGGMMSTIAPTPSDPFNLHVGGVLSLKAGDRVELAVFSNTDRSYRTIVVMFSAAFLAYPMDAIGFNVDLATSWALKTTKKFTTVGSWNLLTSSNDTHGLFSSGGFDMKKGTYTVPRSGIYLVQAQVQLDKADAGFFTVQVTVNNSATTMTGMTAMKTGSTAKNSFTQNLAGALYLSAGTTLQLDVQSDTDTSYTVSSSSGFSASYVAQLGRVEAVHASLSSDYQQTRAGYQDIVNWAASSAEPFIFSPYLGIRKGEFTAHTNGYYYVSATITFDQLTTGFMSVLVYRTAVTGNAWIVNSKKGEPVSNAKDSSKNTIVVAALVRLLKFDKIKVQTYSSRDNSYVVKKSSSLSVVFVGGSQPERCPISGVRVITQPVLRQIVAIGDPASLWIHAAASSAIKYTWYRNYRLTSTYTTNYVNISSVGNLDRGTYYCVVTSGNARDQSLTGFLDTYQPVPRWISGLYRANLYENSSPRTLVLTVRAIYETMTHAFPTARYQITAGTNAADFSLDANSGQLRVAKSIDRERQSSYSMSLLATNKMNATKTAVSRAIITILDRNDNAPICTRSTYTARVVENSPKGTIVGAISATDRDIGNNAAYRFSITGGNTGGYFAIDAVSKNVIINKPIDREALTSNTIVITLRASNIVSGPTSTCLMAITVLDLNDNSPTFKPASYMANQSEASAVGTVFETVTATDPDLGTNGTVTYTISTVTPAAPGLFLIDSKTGALSLANTLDHDAITKYTITVTAADGDKQPHTATAQVVIYVLDANDNRPLFTLHNYYATIVENSPKGVSVVRVLATDVDPNPMTYSIKPGGDASAFSIDSKNGLVLTTIPLDRESRDPYVFQVQAVDGGSPPQTGSATVSVDVLDVNDNSPQFAHSTFRYSVAETTAVGSALGQIAATDADDGSNAEITYSLMPAQTAFIIQSGTGVLELNTALDYAKTTNYTLTVRAVDGGTPARTSTATVIVTVQDSNTNAPKFAAQTFTTSILENSTLGTAIRTVVATDPDPGPTGLTYSILHGAAGKFTINNSTGQITLAASVDYETQRGYELVIRCQDSFTPALSSITFVLINLLDVNDNPPVFSPASMSFTVNPAAGLGTWILNASATDADSGTNAALTYSRGSGSFLNVSTSGVVILGMPLPESGTFSIQVVATDGGTPALSGTLVITISVGAASENPTFLLNKYLASISENTLPMTTVVRPRALLPGEIGSGDLKYSLGTGASKLFSIDSVTGNIRLVSTLDSETKSSYTLTVQATYMPEGAVTTQTGTTQVIVTVTDFNDNAPVFSTASANTKFMVSQADPAGTLLGRVSATDADTGTNAAITFGMVSGGDGVIRVDPNRGILYTADTLNALQQSVYNIVVSAVNNVLYPLQSTVNVTVNVASGNDHKPTFVHNTYTYHLSENTAAQTVLGSVSATDIDAGADGTVTYGFVSPAPASFAISSTTGQIRLTGPLDREVADHVVFQVRAADGASPSLSDVCSVYVYVDDVNDNSPTFSQATYTTRVNANTSPGTGIIAVVATDADAGTLGTAGITYSITAGDSSQRFSMQSSGVIQIQHLLSQLPTTTYTLTVQAGDGGSPPRSGTAKVTVSVLPANSSAPVFEHTSYAVVQNDQIMKGSVVFTAQAKGSGVLTYSLFGTGLPFTIDSKTGAVSANSTLNADSQSVYAIPIVAKDQYGLESTMHLLVTLTHINEHAPVFNPQNATGSVSEGASLGQSVLTVRATDQDTGSDGQITYVMTTLGPFSVDPQTGEVDLARSVDRETRSVYSLVIDAMDHGMPSLTSETYVTITIGDVNDNPPAFEFPLYNGTVAENEPAGTFAVRPVARDPDLNPMLVYSLPNPNGIFTINPKTGAITTLVTLDREKTPKYDLTVQVSDGRYTALCQVDIVVTDKNDHGPVFNPDHYVARISANSAIGTSIVQVSAIDNDVGLNAIILFELSNPGPLDGYITIDSSGRISVAESPIRVTSTEFTIQINAIDSANTTLTAEATLELTLTNVEVPPTEQIKVTSASEFSTPQLLGVIIGGLALLILILILVIVIVRRPKKDRAPSSFEGGARYDKSSLGGSTPHLTGGAGFTNPMYASEAVKQNPMYGAEGGEGEGDVSQMGNINDGVDDTYDNVQMFQDRTAILGDQ